MKFKLFSLLLVPLLFVWFSFWQFTEDYELSNDTSTSTTINSPIGAWQTIKFISREGGGWNVNFTCNNACSLWYIDLSVWSDNFWKSFTIPDNCYNCRFGIYPYISVKFQSTSSKMPVSSLNPVISWLSGSISEFIPYIVYIWVGLLGACICFVAIKWLLNRLKSKVLNPFRK